MTPALVVFDLGGTLLAPGKRRPRAPDPEAVARLGLAPPALKAMLLDVVQRLEAEEDRPDLRQRPPRAIVVERMRAAGIDPARFDDLLTVMWQVSGCDKPDFMPSLPGARDIVETARSAGARTAAMTNTSLTALRVRAILEARGLLDGFDVLVCSSESGWRKPAPQAFLALERACAVEPGAGIVMVGDDPVCDAQPAAARGYTVILVGDHDDVPEGVRTARDLRAADTVLRRVLRGPAIVPGPTKTTEEVA